MSNRTDNIDIRPATPDDIPQLAALGRQTFVDTFGNLYAPEDLTAFLDDKHSPEYYAAQVDRPDTDIWVAESDGRLVGYCVSGQNSLPCDPPRPDALELSRLYIDKDYHRRGLGRALTEKVMDRAEKDGRREIVLSVFSENLKAQKLYASLGFSKIGEYDFMVGNHADEDWIFLKTL